MKEDVLASNLIIEAIISEKWIAETMDILRISDDKSLYSRTINEAYITAIFICKSRYKDYFFHEKKLDIIKAVLVMNIGETITQGEKKAAIRETMSYVSERTSNETIIDIVKMHYSIESENFTLESKIVALSDCIEAIITGRCKVKEIQKHDVYLVNEWKKLINAFVTKTQEIKVLYKMAKEEKQIKEIREFISPMEIFIESLLNNYWVIDILKNMKNREDEFLFYHSLGTGIHAASIIVFGNNEMFNNKSIHDIIIASVLHDVGYFERDTINHTYHLCMDLSKLEIEINKKHILFGKKWLRDYSEEFNIMISDTIYEVIENHHEYEDGTGLYGRKQFNKAVKIVNLANAIDLQMYRAKKLGKDFTAIRDDSSIHTISKKFDTSPISKIIYNSTVYLEGLSKALGSVVNE